VRARTLANGLLEADEDFNVSAEFDRLTTSGYPGIEIESEGKHWNVYKKAPGNLPGLGTPGSYFIGEITYDDMADMPKETMTPENIAYWDSHRWFAVAGFRDSERQMCASFTEAIQWIIAVNIAKTTPPITQKLDKDDLNNLYSDVCLELFNTRDTGAISQADYEALEQEVTRRQKQLRRPQEALINESDPDDPSENIERFATERSAPVEMRFTNGNGRPFRVRLIFDKVAGGTSYDGEGNVVPHEPQPTVEFYDMTRAKENSSFKDYGQYVSSYEAATLMDHEPHVGLDLYGGEHLWIIDGDSTDKVLAWIKEQVESRGYKLVDDSPGDISFGKRYEALDPDDPEPYLHPERFTGQPGYERIESDLRVMLRPYYPEVRISRRPAKFAEVFKGLREYFTWTIHCKRELPLPLPKTRPYVGHRGHDPNSWRQQVENWFEDWAERSGFRLTHFETYGKLRKDPTFQFTTWRLPPTGISRRSGQPIKEAEDDMTPEQIMNDLLPKLDWNKDLEQDLWKFHPYGVTYTVVAAPNLAYVIANTYFPPTQKDFAGRLRDFVVDWLTQRRILVVKSSKLYTFKHVGASPSEQLHLERFPRWTAGVSVNSDWPPNVAADDAPSVEVRQA